MKCLFAILILFCAVLQAAQPQIPIEKFSLKNGMRVILSRDNAVPVVSVYVIYDVGARAEEKGRTGFAHLFEHMMFEGSANAPKGTHFKLIQANGGTMNGQTHPDYTDYFETLPANKLAIGLWLESDRMRSLSITQENLANQKEAVKQERRLSFDNQPYATGIVDRWPELAFQNWQNSHSLIGSFEDLNAASVEDVAKFFKTHYAPNNAVLVLVGDIQIPEARKLIETYFGDIPSQPKPRTPDLAEPSPKPRSGVYHDAHAKVPGVVIGYPGPARHSPDYYAIGMIDILLTGGPSSRFQLDLVKGKQSVVQYQAELGWPFCSSVDFRDPGDYAMFLLYKPNFTGDQIVAQVQEEIARLQNDGVDPKELERARTLFRSDRITALQSSHQRAKLLGLYEVLDGKPEYINTELDRFLAVTPAQIQAAAKQYLTPERRSVLHIAVGAAPPPGSSGATKGGN
ncbi:MAG: insulinase family protein [Acidobacteriia bacterium]|nr:insulinase family protein [Terriglobia bacterium]